MAEPGQGQAPVAPAQPADPVARIEALLDAKRQEPIDAAQPPTEPPEQPPADPGSEEAPAEPNQQVEGDDAQADEPKEVAEIPLEQLESIELDVTVKGDDGRDVTEKQSIKELKLGYMRQKDYQRKTQEVARQRAEAETRVRQGVEAERAQYVQTLQQLQAALVEAAAPELSNINWNQLANENPAEYVRLRNRADQVTQALTQVQTKQREAEARTKAERDQALRGAAAEARATLEADIPGWNDTLYQELLKTGIQAGFKPDEVGSWVDARAIKLLHKAHLYDQLQAGKPPPQKKVVTVPKVVKPGATATTSAAQQKQSDALKRLKTSGKLEDAAAVIAGRL